MKDEKKKIFFQKLHPSSFILHPFIHFGVGEADGAACGDVFDVAAGTGRNTPKLFGFSSIRCAR
jgi:hypothetical protein